MTPLICRRTNLEDALARAAAAEGLRVVIEPHPEAGIAGPG